MFKCQTCSEKDKIIEFLKEQNKDLLDRLMAFNKDAFTYYNAEKKIGEPLYPIGVNDKGEIVDYKTLDITKANQDMFNAFGEEPIEVEDKV